MSDSSTSEPIDGTGFGLDCFFELQRLPFDPTPYRHPWDLISELGNVVERMVPGDSVIEGQVHGSAHVAGRGVYIAPDAVIGPDVCIEGPCYIGRGAQVRHGAYIRGDVIMLDGAVLGHASEAKNSLFMQEAKAPHFAYVGDSILGARVNLGAGTILSNLGITNTKDESAGGRRSIQIEVEGKLYDTGLSKMGAVLGDDSQTGCNVVLNPGVLLGRRCLIYPNVSVRRGYIHAGSIIKLRQSVEIVKREDGRATSRGSV